MIKKSSFTNKILLTFVLILVTLTAWGVVYPHWSETLYIDGLITTGTWKPCIRIYKVLEGAFTDPETGCDLTEPTSFIAIASEEFPTKFKLIIYVKNCGSIELTDVIVMDRIELNVAPFNSTPSKGTVDWVNVTPPGNPGDFVFNYLTWHIGSLSPDEEVSLVIWIETLKNPAGKYEPTSGDECDCQDLEINRGATVMAKSMYKTLSTTTEYITLHIVDDCVEENGIGVITPDLPYSTPIAEEDP